MNTVHLFMTAISSFMDEGVLTLQEAEELANLMLEYTDYDPIEVLEHMRKPTSPRPKPTKTT